MTDMMIEMLKLWLNKMPFWELKKKMLSQLKFNKISTKKFDHGRKIQEKEKKTTTILNKKKRKINCHCVGIWWDGFLQSKIIGKIDCDQSKNPSWL